jgi:hypothetical protein
LTPPAAHCRPFRHLTPRLLTAPVPERRQRRRRDERANTHDCAAVLVTGHHPDASACVGVSLNPPRLPRHLSGEGSRDPAQGASRKPGFPCKWRQADGGVRTLDPRFTSQPRGGKRRIPTGPRRASMPCKSRCLPTTRVTNTRPGRGGPATSHLLARSQRRGGGRAAVPRRGVSLCRKWLARKRGPRRARGPPRPNRCWGCNRRATVPRSPLRFRSGWRCCRSRLRMVPCPAHGLGVNARHVVSAHHGLPGADRGFSSWGPGAP